MSSRRNGLANVDSKAIAKADGSTLITDTKAQEAARSSGMNISIQMIRDRATVGNYISQFTTGLLQSQASKFADAQERVAEVMLGILKTAKSNADKIGAANAISTASNAWVDNASMRLKIAEISGVQHQERNGRTLAPQIIEHAEYVQVNNFPKDKEPKDAVTVPS